MEIDDDDIRELFNIKDEGTVTDALIRHDCKVALGERVIGAEGEHPEHLRYPTRIEREIARKRCFERIEARRED